MEMIPSESGPWDYTLAPLPPTLMRRLTNEESRRVNKINPTDQITDPLTQCRTCLGKGEFPTRLLDDSVVLCKCSCMEQWMLSRILLESGIGDAYQRYGFNHLRGVSPQVMVQVVDYFNHLSGYLDAGIGMFLWSHSGGTGKSLILNLIIKQIVALGEQGYFATMTDFMEHHTASWSDEDHRKWFNGRVRFAKGLGLDDIGKENPNRVKVVDEALDAVVRGRINHALALFISSNLNPEHLGDLGKDFSRYQAGLLSLLNERTIVIEMVGGTDYRRTRRDELMRDAREGIRYPVVIR